MMRLIDADELMEHVYRDKLDSRELIAEMVNNAPSVMDVTEAKKRRKGRWITTELVFHGVPFYRSEIGTCSRCGWDTGEPLDMCLKWFRFCPHCGAEMGGGK